MGWVIAIGMIVLLAILPLGVRFLYDSGGPVVLVLAGPVRFTLIPSKKDKPKRKKEEKKKPAQKGSKKQSQKKGGSIKDFMPLVQTALDFLEDLRRKLRVRHLELNLILAGDDPCDLAINYGKAWVALGNLWPKLEQFLVIKKRDVKIQCDFEASQTLVTARVEITITLGRLLALGTVYGFRGIKEFIRLQNIRKGGTVK